MKKRLGYKYLAVSAVLVALVLTLVGFGQLHAQLAKVIYIYDDLGRLMRVVNESNECATYEYDAVGNMLSITRSTNCLQPPTVDSLSQNTANAGDTACLTITGTNFLGATVTTDNPDVQISRLRVSETSIEVCLNISFFSPVGATRIVVNTPGGFSERTFTVGPRVMVITQDTSIDENNQNFENATVEISGRTLTVDGPHTFANLTLRNGAVLTYSPTAATTVKKLDVRVSGALTVDATSRIDVTGRGFLGGAQPGNPFVNVGMTVGFQPGSGIRAGGSYGGLGGATPAGAPNPVYGDFRDPNEVGSGGGASSGAGGNGGGLIRIVAQTLQLEGSIVANGANGTLNSEAGAGSGGGIRIDAGILRGLGTIGANGGMGASGFSGGSGGGGGRVAVYYQDVTGFDLSKLTAFGGSGSGSGSNSGAGTVYLQGPARETGELIVDNNNLTSVSLSTPILSQPSGLLNLTNIRVRRTGKVKIEDQVNLTGTLEASFGGELTLSKGVIASTVDVNNSGLITQLPATASQFFKVELNANTLTVDVSSRIDVTGRGFLGGAQPGNPFVNVGMTVGFQPGSGIRAGGSYGGLGGVTPAGAPNPVYGDLRDPNEVGSGGGASSGAGGNGGGLIRIVAQTLQLEGSIVANGGDGASNSEAGGGSGGGIRIDVGTLRGSGTISANGGRGGPLFAGGPGGGGGRVAVYYHDAVEFDLTKVTAFGGSGFGSGPSGQNGTVFVELLLALWSPTDPPAMTVYSLIPELEARNSKLVTTSISLWR
jgi:YD repeat-containing protein